MKHRSPVPAPALPCSPGRHRRPTLLDRLRAATMHARDVARELGSEVPR